MMIKGIENAEPYKLAEKVNRLYDEFLVDVASYYKGKKDLYVSSSGARQDGIDQRYNATIGKKSPHQLGRAIDLSCGNKNDTPVYVMLMFWAYCVARKPDINVVISGHVMHIHTDDMGVCDRPKAEQIIDGVPRNVDVTDIEWYIKKYGCPGECAKYVRDKIAGKKVSVIWLPLLILGVIMGAS